MNLFHTSNHRYQSLLSAGVKVTRASFSLSFLARSRYRVAQSRLVRLQPVAAAREIRSNGVGELDFVRFRHASSQLFGEEAADAGHSGAPSLRFLSQRWL